MNRKTQMDNKGFSLVELLICLAISSFVILAAYSLVLVGTRSYNDNNKNASIQKEVSFTTNMLAENIRNAKCDKTSITYTNSFNDIEIHTGERVICYDKSEKSLYIYEEDSSKPIGDIVYWGYDKANLISKYITSFKAEFVSGTTEYDEVETPVSAAPKTVNANAAVYKAGEDGTSKVYSSSDMIKFTITFDVNGKTDTTEVMYQIRN